MSKKKGHNKAAERRRREMERLQETVEQQLASMPASPPASQEQPPGLPKAEDLAALDEDELWAQFEKTDAEGKETIFLEALKAGKLDEEYAFEMLSDIRSGLDPRKAEDRELYADLVGQLREQAPDLYRYDAVYYSENLIRDAIAEERWERLPEMLSPFVESPEKGIETFTHIVDQLMYHGHIRPLIQAMAQAWPQMSESSSLFEWVIEEFGGRLMLLYFFDYLETTENPRADDPALLEATAHYGKWKEGWLERFIQRATAPAPSDWQPADFGPAVDADQWRDNVDALLAEFVVDQHRLGVPYSRGHLAQNQLSEALGRQIVASLAPKSRRGEKKGKRKPSPKVAISPLVPQYETMDKTLVDLLPFLGAQPYKVAAVLELLPAYLHFIARLGLIHPTQMDAALDQLEKLAEHGPRILDDYGADLRTMDAVVAAWSDEALSALRNDPALAEVRETSPVPSPALPEAPPRRPGALQTYTFKVSYLNVPDVWRAIEIAENQTLDDLHDAIQDAVDFDADHLYSFYMSGKAWDQATEYASPHAKGPNAARVRIGDLNLRMKQRFLYLFDYGDEHHFEIQLINVDPDASQEVDYPRVVERHGKNPTQYPG